MSLSRRIYELSLLVYPRALRQKYGEDMAEVFEFQLSAARGSFSGSVRVWWDACQDLVSIALPRSATSPAFLVPLTSVFSTFAIYAVLSWALENPLRLNSMYHALIRNL